ncbi:MAG TPA: glycosyltransferase family 2 protein [Candidatus Paceibacterota bacterium]|jgi:Glycosyltransferases involved in cell wall biogenesis
MQRKTISFVLPVYNESAGVRDFHKELSGTFKALEKKYEVEALFVNDGSHDGTAEVLREIADVDNRVRVLHFSRNFGHQIAVTAGLDHATGDAIVIMDTDLQDPPAIALELVREWEDGHEVVYAQRRSRKDTIFKRATAHAFYKILNRLSDTVIPENTGDFRLLDRKAAEAVRQYRESHRFVRGIAAHVGFKQKAVLFDRAERTAGETHYPLKRMLRLSADAVVGFSTAPLRLITKAGFLVSGLSFLGILYAVSVRIFFAADAVPGWAFMTVAIFFMGGVQMLMLGIIGEYVGRIYAESKGRPLYIVSSVYSSQDGKVSKK